MEGLCRVPKCPHTTQMAEAKSPLTQHQPAQPARLPRARRCSTERTAKFEDMENSRALLEEWRECRVLTILKRHLETKTKTLRQLRAISGSTYYRVT